MSFTPSIVSILRAPNGEKLSFDGSSFVSENGTAYKFEKGVAFLYDEKDVPHFSPATPLRFSLYWTMTTRSFGRQNKKFGTNITTGAGA